MDNQNSTTGLATIEAIIAGIVAIIATPAAGAVFGLFAALALNAWNAIKSSGSNYDGTLDLWLPITPRNILQVQLYSSLFLATSNKIWWVSIFGAYWVGNW